MRKSITPVIAIVLLLLLTVGIATVTFFWISSLQMRMQQTPSTTVQSITEHPTDKLRVVSLSNQSITVQDTSGENITDVSVFVDGVNRTLNFTQEGQFIIISWDTENVTVTGDFTDVDIITNAGSVSQGVGPAEAANVFTAVCPSGYCKLGKESPNTCPEDCESINVTVMGGGGRLGWSVFSNLEYLSVVYSTYTDNWSPVQIASQTYNDTRLNAAYDYNNNPAVFFGKKQTEGAKHYDMSYSFWTGSSWTSVTELMTNLNSSYFSYAFSGVDFFTDNNAIFAWFNRTDQNGNYDIYYALGNQSSVSSYKQAFSGINLTGLTVKVDKLDRAVMVFGNTTTVTNKTTLYYSVYDRTADQWSSPQIIAQYDISSLFFNIGAQELSFNSANKATILAMLYYFDFSTFQSDVYSNVLINGQSGSWSAPYNISSQIHINSLKRIAYDGLDNLVILGGCNATEFNAAYGRHGLCYNTYDGTTISSSRLIEKTEFNAGEVRIESNLLSNKEGSLFATFCASNGTGYNIYVMEWDDADFVNPTAVEYYLLEYPEPSCPFLYSWDGNEYWFEHESYGFAVFRGWEYTSYERLDYLKPVDGLLRLKLTEELPETSYTDSLILKAVEHDPSLEVLPDLDGVVHTISEWNKPITCTDYDGVDCLELVSEDEGLHWRTDFDSKDLTKDEDLRDGIILEFNKPAGTVSPKLFLRLKDSGFLRLGGETIIETLGSNNIDYFYDLFSDAPIISGLVRNWRKGIAELIVSVWDGVKWVEVESFGVGSAAWNEVLISLNEVSTDSVKVKLESSSGVYLIEQARIDYSIDQEVKVIELSPISMIKDGESVLETLRIDDNERLMLDQGDEVEVVFEAIEETPGKAYSYMTDIKGYYEIYPPINEVALDLSVYVKVLRLLDPRVTARHVYNKLLDLNLDTGMGNVGLITSLAMFGLVILIAVVIALV